MPDRDPQILASINPRIRKSPFFDGTVEDGLAAVTCYNQMWLPTSYGDPDAEYRRLTEGVAMWDVAAQRHIEVRGPDADDLVQRIAAIDVPAVEPGRGAYAPVVDASGVLLNDPILLRGEDGTWRFSIADSDLRLWIDAVALDLDAEVRELDTATLAIQGPSATDVLAALGCPWFDDLEYFERRPAHIDGVDVVVSRSGWSNHGGAELFLDDPAAAMVLWRAVHDAGRPHGIGPGAPNQSERIENVLLSYGTDTGFDADPIELGLVDSLDLDGPDFIGRDALVRIREQGASRRLAGVVIDGERLEGFGHPTEIASAGNTVGVLRIAAWSPKHQRNLGLALVGVECEPGTEGRTELPDGSRSVRLVDLPFDLD